MDTELFLKLSDGLAAPKVVLRDLDEKELAQIKPAADADPVNKVVLQEVVVASYYLSLMYKKGIGMTEDIDKSARYLKRAADLGYDRAQLEYGERLFLWHSDVKDVDPRLIREGFEYIEKAADAGLVDAIKKYIEYVRKSPDVDAQEVAKAKEFVNLIKGRDDAYSSSTSERLKKELAGREKAARLRAWNPMEFIVGEVLFVAGVLYLFKGLNPVFFAEKIPKISRMIPHIADAFIIKWTSLTKVTAAHMTNQGIFGCWLVLIGNILHGMSVRYAVKIKRNIACRIIGILTLVAVISLIILHFPVNLIETGRLFGNGGSVQFLALGISFFIGRIIGFVVSKILK